MSKILVYKKGVEMSPPACTDHAQIACPVCWTRRTNPIPSPSSLMRSKTSITDYTLANQFDLFCTFTFNPELVDSFDVQACKDKMSKWLNNARRHSPELRYLIVAEKHKSGRIHFHALFKDYCGRLDDSKRSKNNRPILNIHGWRYGFSTAIQIDNIDKVSSYMQKYITKDMLKIGNKKRFWTSRNLNKPTKSYNVNMVEEIYSRPLFVTDAVEFEYYKIYKVLPKITQMEKSTKRGKAIVVSSH